MKGRTEVVNMRARQERQIVRPRRPLDRFRGTARYGRRPRPLPHLHRVRPAPLPIAQRRSVVKKVRAKLGAASANPAYLFTHHGVGYRIGDPGEA